MKGRRFWAVARRYVWQREMIGCGDSGAEKNSRSVFEQTGSSQKTKQRRIREEQPQKDTLTIGKWGTPLQHLTANGGMTEIPHISFSP